MAPHIQPWIGLDAGFTPTGKTGNGLLTLAAAYPDAVLAAGGIPVVLPPRGTNADWEAVLDRLDGFVLTSSSCRDTRREENDQRLLRALLTRQLPLLAVGRGMQQLNVVRGGTLFTSLPDDLPQALPHRAGRDHPVLVEVGSRLEEVYGGGEIRVASMHDQAVRKVGAGLRVAALAPDGVIEAVEAADPDWFCVGVQWLLEGSARDARLLEHFVQVCRVAVPPLRLAA
jgi:putative glutamine amidotransferase